LLTAPAAGVVRTLEVQIGDRVARGTVVAELDVPELRAEARQKETAAAQAEREATRQQQLLADGIASARQAEEATAAAEQAKAAAAAARDLLARTHVTSPLSGAVAQVLVQRGERVDEGRLLLQVVASDTLDLIVPVPAGQLPRLRPGLPVVVRQEGDSIPAAGRIAALAPGVDSMTNTGRVVIRVPNQSHRLRPGAPASAEVLLGRRLGVLSVPDSALVLAGDHAVVFVVGADSIAHQRVVRRGIDAGGRSEVTGDLQVGDRVVTTGAFGLQDGMHVVPTVPAPPGSDRPE
jgi:RND family efflux transporter MFP subunit